MPKFRLAYSKTVVCEVETDSLKKAEEAFKLLKKSNPDFANTALLYIEPLGTVTELPRTSGDK